MGVVHTSCTQPKNPELNHRGTESTEEFFPLDPKLQLGTGPLAALRS